MVNAGPFHGTVVENLSTDLQDAEAFIFRVCQCPDRKDSENTAGQQNTLTEYLTSLSGLRRHRLYGQINMFMINNNSKTAAGRILLNK